MRLVFYLCPLVSLLLQKGNATSAGLVRIMALSLFLYIIFGWGEMMFLVMNCSSILRTIVKLTATHRLLRASMFCRDASERLPFTLGVERSECLLVTMRTCVV